MNDSPIHVVAGILTDEQGHVLVAQRGVGKHLAGAWEFPGGKVDSGEDAHAALKRELHEELGVEIGGIEPLIGVPWCYPGKDIFLDAYRVLAHTGVPHGRENQAIAWHRIDELSDLDMPPPDRPIVNALRLPERYAITPEPGADDGVFLSAIERGLAGVRLLRFRAKSIDRQRQINLARACGDIARCLGVQMLVNGDVELATASGADGVHLSSAQLMGASERPVIAGKWVAASCHDAFQIRKANALGVDFGVLGPVASTTSHPSAIAIGWGRFADLCALAAFPVFALGGLRSSDLGTARAVGAQGIAGISAFFDANSTDR